MPLSDDELMELFVESVEAEPSEQETREIGEMIQTLSLRHAKLMLALGAKPDSPNNYVPSPPPPDRATRPK
jgi:hypothetical protein